MLLDVRIAYDDTLSFYRKVWQAELRLDFIVWTLLSVRVFHGVGAFTDDGDGYAVRENLFMWLKFGKKSLLAC
jgi:hypothetical protein